MALEFPIELEFSETGTLGAEREATSPSLQKINLLALQPNGRVRKTKRNLFTRNQSNFEPEDETGLAADNHSEHQKYSESR